MKIAVLKETAPGEKRVAATPETVKKFIALGAEIAVERGAGASSSIADADYEAAGATLADRAGAIKGADIVLAVQGPEPADLKGSKPGAWLAAILDPFGQRARVDAYAAAGIEAAEGKVDETLRRVRPAFDDGPIGLVDLAMLEQAAQMFESLAMSPQHEAAGGIPVQPMGERGRARHVVVIVAMVFLQQKISGLFSQVGNSLQ